MALDGKFHIAERPVAPVGTPQSTSSSFYNTTNTYDVAIGGIPFFLGNSEKYPYKRETAQYRKTQSDVQKEPGEQTLTGWWLRSQSSFHYGAGIRFEEPMQGETVPYRYNRSAGVDVFNIGKVSLINDTTLIQASASTAPEMIGGTDANGVDVVIWSDDGTLYRTTAAGVTTTLTWGGSGTILAVASDGLNYYAANATGIYKGPLTGASSGTSVFTHPTMVGTVTTVTLAWVKQRLIAGVNNYLFEVTPITSFGIIATSISANTVTLKLSTAHNFVVGAVITVASVTNNGSAYNGTWSVIGIPSSTQVQFYHNNADLAYDAANTGTVVLASNNSLPVYAHPNTNWQWTGICEGPNAIYAAGYAGDSSSVFRLAIDTSGQVPLLTKALTAADMPKGEVIYALGSYIGKYMVFGTSKGIRVGQIDTSGFVSSGFITYGPLTVVTNGYDPATATTLTGLPCYSVTFNDRYAYCTVSNYIDPDGTGTTYKSGLVKIDLSREVAPNQMGWATHLQVNTTSNAVAVCMIGSTNKLAIGAYKSGGTGNGIYFQTNTLISSGYLQTGLIRFNTLEDKHYKYVKMIAQSPALSNLKLSVVFDDNTSYDVITTDPSFDLSQEIATNLASERSALGLRFTITPTADLSNATVFNGYQLKALPAVHRVRLITLPLMNFDFEGDRYNMTTGYEGRAAERLNAIEALEAPGNIVTFQDFTTNETVQGVIEGVTFERTSAPERRFKGAGGILYVQIRTI